MDGTGQKTIALDMPDMSLLRVAGFLRDLANDSPLSVSANNQLSAAADEINLAIESYGQRIDGLRAGEQASEGLHRQWHDRSLRAEQTMSDQEIRARALECAVRLKSTDPDYNAMFLAHKFEAYIRDGVT